MISESFYLPSLDSVEYNIQQHVWHKNWVLYKGTHAAAQTPSLAFVAPTQVSAKRKKRARKVRDSCRHVRVSWIRAHELACLRMTKGQALHSDLNRAQTSGNEGGVGD